jgi:hypothetical protein
MKGMMCENKTISDSISDFQHNRKKLEQPDEEDLDDKAVERIYTEIARNANSAKGRKPHDTSIINQTIQNG